MQRPVRQRRGSGGRPIPWRHPLLSLLLIAAFLAAPRARAGDIEDQTFADRPISLVTLKGLNRISEQEIRNNLRIGAGEPFESLAVRADVASLYRLGHFETVSAEAMLQADGSVEVIYTLVEQSLVLDIQTVGNKAVSDQELRAVISLYPGGPRDDFLLEQSVLKMKELYRGKGHYLVEITVKEDKLKDSGILIFEIVEGPRVRIQEVEFVGNRAFQAKQLSAEIKTKPWVFLFRKGNLDEEMLVDDVATLDKFYKDRGFVDVRVDRRVELSSDQKEAKVVFVIDEGREYRLRSVRVESTTSDGQLKVFSSEQLRSLMTLRPGDAYQKNRIDSTTKSIQTAYFVMGYIDAKVNVNYVRSGEEAEVDMLVSITEGDRFETGLVHIQGNFITRDKIIRRLVRFQPGRPMDGREIELTEVRLKSTNLFNDIRVTPQEPDPDHPESRDVLVEVKEKNTGSVNFGLAIGTDQGFGGEISLNQYNFDIADVPTSLSEFAAGRAFRGAGQTFSIAIQPGIDVSTYSISFGEPHLFETDWSGSTSLSYRNRIYDQWTEERTSIYFGTGRRLGDFWTFGSNVRLEQVALTDFAAGTPLVIVGNPPGSTPNQSGPSQFGVFSVSLSRNTVDSRTRPGSGSLTEVTASMFAGDYSFPMIRANYTTFLTLDEDFLGRKTTLRLNSQVGYITSDSSPVFERFYLGGSSLRGFAFRTISPVTYQVLGFPDSFPPTTQGPGNGAPATNIGGQFMFFAGAQYETPLFQDAITAVAFLDSGTVTGNSYPGDIANPIGLGQYRLSVGVGLRLYIGALGPAPIALDFGFPILKQSTDQTQLFSFNAALPF
ncbi:MAG: outer membrane protein assembly factor BamA [Planctomycetes bacterium]|nr:outer membrane protein assembly factor BamA [Planctomycetota bacterium]